MKIRLQIPEDARPALSSRLTYAFRLFCAVYGHTPLLDSSRTAYADVILRYRHSCASQPDEATPVVSLCRGLINLKDLNDRDPQQQPAPAPIRYARHGVITLLRRAPECAGCPDWLGEIFEWVSCADELNARAREGEAESVAGQTCSEQFDIDRRVPYAALAMRCLQQEICRAAPGADENPRAPEGVRSHVVIPIHFVNYLPLGRMHTALRLARNAVASWVTHRRALSLQQAFQAARVACGSASDPLDQLLKLAEEEHRLGISASYYFQTRRTRRLDSGYTLHSPGVLDAIRWLQAKGMEIGLNGSAAGVGSPLLEEIRCLGIDRSSMEKEQIYVRGCHLQRPSQTLDRTITAVENAGLEYDCSLGWSTHLGFRAGACFPFPPYDFTKEAPASFLEFPLVAVDQALTADEQQFHDVAQMIAASRRLGWGGISLLWHPSAFGAGWLPQHVGEMYWRLAGERTRWNDSWMTASDFLDIARGRFVETGLLAATTPDFAPLELSSAEPSSAELSSAASAAERSGAECTVALTRKTVNA